MKTVQRNDRTDDPSSGATSAASKFQKTVSVLVSGAATVAGVIRPVVKNLSETYEKLGPISVVVDSVEAGLREAKEQLHNREGEENGSEENQ